MSAPRPAPPCTLVVFGATGDLVHRLLVPALYNLARWGLLPEEFRILGISRSERSSEDFRTGLAEAVTSFLATRRGDGEERRPDRTSLDHLLGHVEYLAGDLSDEATYGAIRERVGATSALFYLAIAPDLFGEVVERLGRSGLTKESDGAFRRVVIEKPFGHDHESARALNRRILSCLDESQVFRMDHFLGKETVQNIVAFRFGNGLFEPLWNRDHIDHVQITVAETVGVEKRGKFYDGTGALRDMVPNHLFQLFALTAMEPPLSFDADAVRDRKEDAMRAVRRMTSEEAALFAVRGQYGAGVVNGKPVVDYGAEPNVAPGSRTETYAALRLTIDNWRWAGVPFYLRTGKALRARDTEIAIRFKEAPLALFGDRAADQQIANWLVLQLQPDESISLQFGAKRPGPELSLAPVRMSFRYRDFFETEPSTGYETLIYDALIGDASLYQRADTIEAGWRAVQPLLDLWAKNGAPLARYEAGSDGPREADELPARDGRAWREIGPGAEPEHGGAR